jgi:hypothetical protein
MPRPQPLGATRSRAGPAPDPPVPKVARAPVATAAARGRRAAGGWWGGALRGGALPAAPQPQPQLALCPCRALPGRRQRATCGGLGPAGKSHVPAGRFTDPTYCMRECARMDRTEQRATPASMENLLGRAPRYVCVSLRSDPGADQRLALARREPRRNVDGGFRFLVQDARMLHRPWARRIKRQRPYKFTAGAHAAWPARVGFMRPSGQYRGASCLSPKAYISTDLRPPLPSGPPLPMEREYPTAARSPAAPPCRGVSTPCSPSLQGCEYPL